MTEIFPPALIFIIGALMIPLLKGWFRSVYLLFLPAFAFVVFLNIPKGTYGLINFLGYRLLLRVDALSLVFGYVFVIIAFIGIIYALQVKDTGEHVAAFVYAGSALGIVFAGDFISLFVFWETLTLSATCVIWSRRNKLSQGAGFRYLLIHLFGGVCLLAGIILRVYNTGSIDFEYIGLNGLASYLIFLGFVINAAVPPLHAWLTDAYPEASITGTVFLSAFTTKSGIYVLARAYPGAEILVVAGAIMTVFPIFYAVLENDLRRVLSYSLINQVGFMVTGIGLGTALAINGAVAHAFCDVLFKALLFMAVGAVMYRTGTCKATDLGGLYKTMPVTLIFCLVGAASISAFPLFSAFVSKSMILAAAGQENLMIVWLLLLFASAGVFHHAGIKVPYFIFFAHDSGKRPPEAPLNMLIAMGIAAFLCIFIGAYPKVLYSILPYPVEYMPYTSEHVISQLLLLCFASLAFAFLVRSGYYPPEKRAINLDADWLYRKGAPALIALISTPLFRLSDRIGRAFFESLPSFLVWFGKNPPAAIKIAVDTALLTFSRPEKKIKTAQRLENEKKIYPADTLFPWSIGAAVSFVLLIFLVYLLTY
jgi:multicomponent Na+:H+ antiporter subunit D